jgi:hypothetical protein
MFPSFKAKLNVDALNLDLDAATVDIRGNCYTQRQDPRFRRLQLVGQL